MEARQSSVWVVDDHASAREAVAGLVRSAGIEVSSFASAGEFLDAYSRVSPACLVLDVSLPDMNGLDLQMRLAEEACRVPTIVITGHGDIPMSVRAMKAGAVDFFTKPFDGEQLLETILRAVRRSQAPEPCSAPSTSGMGPSWSQDARTRVTDIIGRSRPLIDVLAQVEKVAHTDATVLVHGETGTGKEAIARAVHTLSPRQSGPFIKVNCSAIPSGLMESELMGHERGAFTGAVSQRIGRFEMAHNGTIFLDEVGELPLDLQPKLLRVLQEREFERVGGTRTVRSNARLVAATNRDLHAMVRERRYREDLYYRLNVFPVLLPPLRERREDIPELATHFMHQVAQRMRKDMHSVSAQGLRRLLAYHWPGNIRELQNVIERAVILSPGDILDIPPLDDRAQPPATRQAPRDDHLDAVSRAHILGVLEATRWVIAGPNGAAAKLGMKRSTLHFRMKKLGITREASQDTAALVAGSRAGAPTSEPGRAMTRHASSASYGPDAF